MKRITSSMLSVLGFFVFLQSVSGYAVPESSPPSLVYYKVQYGSNATFPCPAPPNETKIMWSQNGEPIFAGNVKLDHAKKRYHWIDTTNIQITGVVTDDHGNITCWYAAEQGADVSLAVYQVEVEGTPPANISEVPDLGLSQSPTKPDLDIRYTPTEAPTTTDKSLTVAEDVDEDTEKHDFDSSTLSYGDEEEEGVSPAEDQTEVEEAPAEPSSEEPELDIIQIHTEAPTTTETSITAARLITEEEDDTEEQDLSSATHSFFYPTEDGEGASTTEDQMDAEGVPATSTSEGPDLDTSHTQTVTSTTTEKSTTITVTTTEKVETELPEKEEPSSDSPWSWLMGSKEEDTTIAVYQDMTETSRATTSEEPDIEISHTHAETQTTTELTTLAVLTDEAATEGHEKQDSSQVAPWSLPDPVPPVEYHGQVDVYDYRGAAQLHGVPETGPISASTNLRTTVVVVEADSTSTETPMIIVTESASRATIPPEHIHDERVNSARHHLQEVIVATANVTNGTSTESISTTDETLMDISTGKLVSNLNDTLGRNGMDPTLEGIPLAVKKPARSGGVPLVSSSSVVWMVCVGIFTVILW